MSLSGERERDLSRFLEAEGPGERDRERSCESLRRRLEDIIKRCSTSGVKLPYLRLEMVKDK